LPPDFETLVEHGGGIAGSPATVRDRVRAATEEAGTNYFISQFSFGDLAHEEVMHSAALFAREVLPMSQPHLAQAAGS
jgi:alkanesulfonate monooxygenase SsuD/methylene tetrahydromethanopterin reductase-like flavin-dependent oxidoreductase (luciferase family)